MSSRPNILLILTDQERQRDWLPSSASLPARQKLIDEGLEFTAYHTHSSPCSPSRATLFTGSYLPRHGVTDNVVFPGNGELDERAHPTLGHELRAAGYRTAYLGKWHLSLDDPLDMERYGFGDWSGNDKAFAGLPGTGVEFDPPIAQQAADWLAAHAHEGPWFLVVALVNPHDVMWFPVDQPEWQTRHPEQHARARKLFATMDWGRADNLPPFPFEYEQHFDKLPSNFDDDLHSKPEVQRRWRWEHERGVSTRLDADDPEPWLRQLDYYVKLHELGDVGIGQVIDALEASGERDRTAVFFTSDHGDQCGSHGLRSKGPWNYDETLRIPLYARVPGRTRPGTKTAALASHADLATTLAALAGVEVAARPGLQGHDLTPLFADPGASVRDEVLFAQDWAWYDSCRGTRYASRGLFDGRYKYCRYYGVGGGGTIAGDRPRDAKRFDADCAFEDQDHELYDLHEDPGELVNLAHDRGRRAELRTWFARLRAQERLHYEAETEHP